MASKAASQSTTETKQGPSQRRHARHSIAQWFTSDIDRAFAAIVCTLLGAIALAGSATHVLHVGAYPTVGVSGWMVWTVAGSLEVLAAYAALEVRLRQGWNRCVPAMVLVMAVSFIVLANLAAAEKHSWAAQLPWAEAFAVAPPISFLSVAAIVETREWRRPGHKRRVARPESPGSGTRTSSASARKQGRETKMTIDGTVSNALMVDEVGREGSAVAVSSVSGLALKPDESRTDSIARWVAEGYPRKVIVKEGATMLGISESTVRRELRGAEREEELP